MRYFTADLHLGSTSIIGYAKRPFSSAEDALAVTLDRINRNLGLHDTLVHVGDFMLSGKDRHGKAEDVGLNWKLNDYLDMINPNVILLAGNHDDGRNCETTAKSMVVDLNHRWRNVSVGHYPSYLERGYSGGRGTAMRAHIHLCGHVHDKWILCWDSDAHVLNVNVGVDVWGYRPVRDAELTSLLDAVFGAKVPMPKDRLTRAEYDAWMGENARKLAEGRERRRAERRAKKNLTPEECERRRVAAMAAKGLPTGKRERKRGKAEDAFSHEDAVQFGVVPPETRPFQGEPGSEDAI